jgi:hypothetical protein
MGLKGSLRKMAAERNGAVQLIPVLNDPSKKIALPTKYRDRILAENGIGLETLIGESPIHAIFVVEGLGLGIFHTLDGKERFVLHGIDLRPGEDTNIEAVGSEVYDLWKAFPQDKLLTWGRLQGNWSKMFRAARKSS